MLESLTATAFIGTGHYGHNKGKVTNSGSNCTFIYCNSPKN